MGMYDRDYYREHHAKQRKIEKRQNAREKIVLSIVVFVAVVGAIIYVFS